MKLTKEFYLQPDVIQLARQLVGKVLITRFNGIKTSGIITETEGYNGVIDRASHAYNERRTACNEHMYSVGGTSYVYICYGIHHLFNVVTNKESVPHAILIRAIKPLEGINHMLNRRNKIDADKNLCGGPGTVSSALGINKNHSGINLTGNTIWIEDRNIIVDDKDIKVGSRIGVESAGDDALIPYRFVYNS